MSIVNTKDKTINTKIVYYGPGLGGKTTSLKSVHQILDPENRNKMVSLKTDEERTLFFDFVPIEIGVVGDYKVKIQGFTVPGQVKYNLTRKYVLMGADAVVFVADSQASRLEENVAAMTNLSENLRANGLNINEIPLVIQYNKRDLADAASIETLDGALNFRSLKTIPTNAHVGTGTFEAFVEASTQMLAATVKRYRLDTRGGNIIETTRLALESLAHPMGG